MTATTRQVSGDRRRETVSLFSPKHYSADNLANECNLASADDRASADDLEIQYHLASADNLEIQYHLASADNLESRHKQTAEPTTKPTNPKRLPPHEAVKFNDQGNPAAASDLELQNPLASAARVDRFVQGSRCAAGSIVRGGCLFVTSGNTCGRVLSEVFFSPKGQCDEERIMGCADGWRHGDRRVE
jgi:hypothetical protein